MSEAKVSKAAEAAARENCLMPPVDVIEDANGISLHADLPGVPRDKLNLHVDGDSLTIEGELALDVPADMTATHVEVKMPCYRRVFTLSKELDADKIRAEFKNGVLTLHIPRVAQAQPRKIAVQVD